MSAGIGQASKDKLFLIKFSRNYQNTRGSQGQTADTGRSHRVRGDWEPVKATQSQRGSQGLCKTGRMIPNGVLEEPDKVTHDQTGFFWGSGNQIKWGDTESKLKRAVGYRGLCEPGRFREPAGFSGTLGTVQGYLKTAGFVGGRDGLR